MSLNISGGMVMLNTKKGDNINISPALRKYVEDTYAEDVDEDLEALNSLRKDVTDNKNSSEMHRDQLLKYWRQLGAVEVRFPISNQPEHISLIVHWYDGLRLNKKCSQSNIHFEKAAVLYNIAAVNCQLGVGADRSTPDGIKVAAHRFQEAAGAFAMLRDQVAPKLYANASVDLSSEALTLLEKLMLAQAQEVFFEKAVGDSKSPAICGKLAYQAGVFYDECTKIASQPPLSGFLDKAWGQHLCVKAGIYHAEALHHTARVGRHSQNRIFRLAPYGSLSPFVVFSITMPPLMLSDIVLVLMRLRKSKSAWK